MYTCHKLDHSAIVVNIDGDVEEVGVSQSGEISRFRVWPETTDIWTLLPVRRQALHLNALHKSKSNIQARIRTEIDNKKKNLKANS